MSKYVLDASVALKMILITEEDAPLALALREEFKSQIHQLIAPDILPMEMAHVLTKAERRGLIRKGQGHTLFADFLDPCPHLYPYGDFIERAMQLSSDFRIGVYDCLYVALGMEENCKVISADQKLLDLFPAHIVTLDSL